MAKKSTASPRPQPQQELLDSVFFALSDPLRRSIVERLQSGPLLVSELAEPFSVSVQAISRHIQVLEEAGLVQKECSGRIRRCSLDVGPILDVVAWLNRYSDYWQTQFAQLSRTLEQGADETARSAKPEPGGRVPHEKRPASPSRDKRATVKKAR